MNYVRFIVLYPYLLFSSIQRKQIIKITKQIKKFEKDTIYIFVCFMKLDFIYIFVHTQLSTCLLMTL